MDSPDEFTGPVNHFSRVAFKATHTVVIGTVKRVRISADFTGTDRNKNQRNLPKLKGFLVFPRSL
jgi:propanediol utilization protein